MSLPQDESADAKLESYKLELNKQLENHKFILAEKLAQRKARDDRFDVIWRAIFEYAQIAIRSVILINGASVTVILTLLGLKGTAAPAHPIVLGIAAGCFAIGAFAGCLATIFAYFNQYQTAKAMLDSHGDAQMGIRWQRTLGIISILAGLLAFMGGVGLSLWGYLGR